MNTIIDILRLRQPRIEYVSPPICGLIPTSASASGSSIILQDNVSPHRPSPAAPTDPAIQTGHNGSCQLLSFLGHRDDLGFLIYQTDAGGNFVLVSNTIEPNGIGVLTAGSYTSAPVDADGVEGPQSAATIISGSGYHNLAIPTSPTAIAYNVYRNGMLAWAMVDLTRDAFEGCNCALYSVQSININGVAMSVALNGCLPGHLSVTPSVLNFTLVPLGSSVSHSFTLTNDGPVGVIGGSTFSLTDCTLTNGLTYSLAPGESILVTIQFSPQTIESGTTTVTFSGAQPLSGTVNTSSQCAVPSTFPQHATSNGTPRALVVSANHRVFVGTDQGHVLVFDGTDMSLLANLTTDMAALNHRVDLVYHQLNNKVYAIDSQSSFPPPGRRPTYQPIDPVTLAVGTSIQFNGAGGLATPFPVFPQTRNTTAIRQSDGMIVTISNADQTLLVLDKNFNILLNATYPGKTFQNVCYSVLTDRFLISESSAGNLYWKLDPNNLANPLVASAVLGNAGTIFCFPTVGGILISRGGGYSIVNPTTETVIITGGQNNADGVTYSACDGFAYASFNTGVLVLKFNPNTGYSSVVAYNSGLVQGMGFDLLTAYKYAVDASNLKVITL